MDLCAFLGVSTPDRDAIDTRPENVGVGGRQARLLRRLNAVDILLKKTTVLPTLNNRIFERLSLDPRGLCQRRLAGVGGPPLEFPEAAEDWAEDWARDWAGIEAAVNRRGDANPR